MHPASELATLWQTLLGGSPRNYLLSALSFVLAGTSQTLKRDRIQIMAELMAAADGATGKTRLMYRSNLDTRALKKYLQYLLDKGFLTLEDGTGENRFYRPTDKGRQFLREYKDVERMLA